MAIFLIFAALSNSAIKKHFICTLKARLCSSQVLVPYDTHRKTRLYVDSSFVGTQATVAQQYTYQGEEVWRPVNHTSRSWTATEAGYGQVERESNGILTGMHMNKMYVPVTHTEVVTDHKPLLPLYNSPSKLKQPRVDRHRTKLAFDYTVIYQPGKDTPCDYESRHPPNRNQFTEEEVEDWCIEADTDVYVNCIIEETLSQAITKDVLREASKKDKEMRALMEDISLHNECRKDLLKSYRGVFNEMWTIDGIVVLLRQPSSFASIFTGQCHRTRT